MTCEQLNGASENRDTIFVVDVTTNADYVYDSFKPPGRFDQCQTMKPKKSQPTKTGIVLM